MVKESEYNCHVAGEKPTSYFRIFDDETFEVKDSVMLDVNESGCSVASVKFADDPNAYFCIGTAYVLPMEEEPSQGRILVVHCTDGKAQIVAEKETKGAVFTLNPIQVCFNRWNNKRTKGWLLAGCLRIAIWLGATCAFDHLVHVHIATLTHITKSVHISVN